MTKSELAIEVLKVIKDKERCTAALSVGSGKTMIGLRKLESIYNSKHKYLVVAPKVSIFNSWIDDSKKFKLEYLLKNITFSTYISLNKQSLDYDFIILDEVHALTFKSNSYLYKYKNGILGLSGTPPTNNKSIKSIMIDKYCPIVYTYKLDEAVNDNMLNDYQIKVHTLELSTVKNILKTRPNKTSYYTSEREWYNWMTNKISISSTKDAMKLGILRMRWLQQLKSKEVLAKKLLDNSEHKCLLFCNTQEQADKLCKHSYHTKNPSSENNLLKFKRGLFTKLSCVEQLSEGINIPNLKEGIIMHFFSSNSPKGIQKLGRLHRMLPTETCILHILCYLGTVDEKNVREGLKQLNQTKITWI